MTNDEKHKSAGEPYPFSGPNAAIEGGSTSDTKQAPPPSYRKTAFLPPPAHPAREQYAGTGKRVARPKKKTGWKAIPRAIHDYLRLQR